MIRATPSDVPALTELMARAFDADPWANWFIRQDEGRAAAFRRFYRLSFTRLAVAGCELYTTAGRTGCALWQPPGRWQPTLGQQLLALPQLLRVIDWRRTRRALAGLEVVASAHPARPHLYLYMLGVDPGHQGKGVGSSLLAPMLARCDRQRLPSYLETAREANVRLYQRFGYQVTGEIRLPEGGPPIWLMWREPT